MDGTEPDLDVPSVYGIANALPRCELSNNIVAVLQSIYRASPSTRRYGFILNRHCCLTELGLMASKDSAYFVSLYFRSLLMHVLCAAEVEQEKCLRLTLTRLTGKKPRSLAPGSSEDSKQKKVIKDLSREGNVEKDEKADVIKIEDAGLPEREAPLTRKRKVETSFQSKKKAVEAVDNYTYYGPPPLQRTLSVTVVEEVVLEDFPRVP
ncbi:hypothetical protein Adt_28586 [Abeliophyllum distichum]|uniref:Uncharacterized protein n=1 Tax=Abeliophyllum distichum TaxID=126358 RepID=A0ABD1RXD5_9LAMI